MRLPALLLAALPLLPLACGDGEPPPGDFRQYHRQEIETMVERLQDPDKRVRGTTLMSLPLDPKHFKDEPELLEELVVPALVDTFFNDEEHRPMAASRLADLPYSSEAAAGAFLAALDEEKTRDLAIEHLPRLGESAYQAIPRLGDLLLMDKDWKVRKRCAIALGLLATGEADVELRKAEQSEKNPEVLASINAARDRIEVKRETEGLGKKTPK